MNEDKLLSVIVPSYNMEKYLDTCLGSFLIEDDELRSRLEVVIVNDGSTDGTSVIAQNYVDRYPEVFRLVNKKNGHYGSCVNVGLREATGVYVKILDADDSMVTAGLCEYLNYLKDVVDSHPDMIINDCDAITADGIMLPPTVFNFNTKRMFSISELPPPSLRSIGMYGIAYLTENLKKMGYVQTEGCAYTDIEWITLPMLTVNVVAYCPSIVMRVLVGREGNTMNSKTYANGFHRVVQLTRGIILKYLQTAQNYTDAARQYVFLRIERQVQHVYSACIIGIDCHKANANLIEFDAFLLEDCPSLWESADKCSFLFRNSIRYVRWWRKHARCTELVMQNLSRLYKGYAIIRHLMKR